MSTWVRCPNSPHQGGETACPVQALLPSVSGLGRVGIGGALGVLLWRGANRASLIDSKITRKTAPELAQTRMPKPRCGLSPCTTAFSAGIWPKVRAKWYPPVLL